MNKFELISNIERKVADLNAQVAEAEKANKSVGRLKRSARALEVAKSLIVTYVESDDVDFPLLDDLCQMVDCKKGHSIKLEVNRGDKVIDLLQKYADVKDCYAKILKAAEAKGLKVVLDHIE